MRVKLFQACSCAVLLAALAVCSRLNAVAQEVPVPPKSSPARLPAYPLRLSANHRYLVDRNNKPFLIVGDTPQDLMSRLTEKEADRYFADREAHGFNTMGGLTSPVQATTLPITRIAGPLTAFFRSPATYARDRLRTLRSVQVQRGILHLSRPHRVAWQRNMASWSFSILWRPTDGFPPGAITV